jgi:hypothetical protein
LQEDTWPSRESIGGFDKSPEVAFLHQLVVVLRRAADLREYISFAARLEGQTKSRPKAASL